MARPLEVLVRDYEWIHLSVGLIGHVSFLTGSILFLPAFEPLKTLGVWLFIIGASAMLIGYAGRALVDFYESHEGRERSRNA
ncbi:MAG: YrhK family protein [Oceanicaulis sp.]